MLIGKIIAILIPAITAAVWIYFFTNAPVSLAKFLLVVVIVPIMLVALYIAFKIWSKS